MHPVKSAITVIVYLDNSNDGIRLQLFYGLLFHKNGLLSTLEQKKEPTTVRKGLNRQ